MSNRRSERKAILFSFVRIAESMGIILCIITINFLLVRFMPGDPVIHIIGEDEYLRYLTHNPNVIDEVRSE